MVRGELFRGSFESKDRQPMDDTSRETQSNPGNGKRSRSGRTFGNVALLLVVVGISAVVFRATYGQLGTTYGQLGALSRPATAEPQAQDPSPPRAEASDNAMPSPNALAQSVQDLQTSQQRTAEELQLIQRQLASEQGERKLLSEQVAALSGRMSGLAVPQPARSALASSATTGTTAAQPPKRKPATPAIGNATPPPRTGAVRPPT
jgi:uncharacterized protein HemX